jgi:FkbM family methyltransferase
MNLIFDIGANIGSTVDIFKTKSKQVIAFEANPTLSNFLKSKYKNQNVVIDGRGLSNKNETKQFKISNADTISTFSDDWVTNSRFSENYVWNNVVDVETITLDFAIELYGIPNYIKIDVEGYEYEVLTSFTKLIPNTVICFEWAEEQKDKIEMTLNHVKNLGYNNFSYTEADKVLFDEEINWVSFENFDIIQKLNPEKKDKWGMIYFKLK